MPTFPVPHGPFAGMTQAQVQAARNTAQQALLNLVGGSQAVAVSYAQGNGNRAVTYKAADEAKLRQLIRQLNQLLGICCGRRAIDVVFR
jgi:gpW